MIQETAVEIVKKALPIVPVPIMDETLSLWGFNLNDWFWIASIGYILVQCAVTVYKTLLYRKSVKKDGIKHTN